MAETKYIPPEVLEICKKVYAAIGEHNAVKVHKLNIDLIRVRAKPKHYQQAKSTIENLQEQIRDLADVE